MIRKSTITKTLLGGGLTLLLAFALAANASAADTVQDFDTPGTPFVDGTNFGSPPPAVIGPDGVSTGQFLRLKNTGLNTNNTLSFDLTDIGPQGHIVADFDFRITCRGSRSGFGCADGFSFVLLNTGISGASGPVLRLEEFGRSVTESPPGFLGQEQFGVGFVTFGGSLLGDLTKNNLLVLTLEYFPAGSLTFINKQLTSGPDENSDGNIDLVVEVKQTSTTNPPYDFDISYANPSGPAVLIVDTVPAEWVVTAINGDTSNLPVDPRDPTANFTNVLGSIDVFRSGKGAKSKSSTKIHWTPPTDGATVNVEAETRQSPSRKVKFAPTSCGPLLMNDGARVFELDPATGEPLRDPGTGEVLPPILESNQLCLAAVEDLDGVAGVIPDGSGDEDTDGLSDLEEACTIGTDPCDFDTDGDTLEDGLEVGLGTDPLNPDTDGDGAQDDVDTDPLDPTVQ